jgi:hypothetical protein
MRKLILGLIVVVLVIGLAWYVASIFRQKSPEPQVGSVTLGGEYNNTTSTSNRDACNRYTARTTVVLASTTPAGFPVNGDENLTAPILGSVVIASTTAHALIIHNATSSSDDASTTIALIGKNAPAGTYTFDVVMNRGIVLDIQAGFEGGYMFNWK